MEIKYFEPLAKKTAINSIVAYQNYISPRKGFSCPHRLVHGGDSCSDYIKRMLTEQTLVEAVKSSLQRFKDCAHTSKTLKTTNSGGGCIVIPCCIPL